MSARAFAGQLPSHPVGVTAAVVCLVGAASSGIVLAVTGNALPLLAVAILALGVILLVRPEIGTLLFLGLLWVNAPAVLTQFHGIPNLVVEVTIGLLLIPVAKYLLLQREPVIITPGLVALLFYIAANLISAAMSSDPALALDEVNTLLGEGLLIYVLVLNAVRTLRMARWSVYVLVAASVLMAGLSVHQEVTEAYLNPYLGFSQTTLEENPAAESRPDARPRMTGPIGEQNRYAQILLVVLPLALFGLNIRHAVWRRIVPLVAGVTIAAGVFLTFSRGAAVALAVLVVVLIVRRYVRLSHMLAIITAFVLTVLIVAPEFLARVDSIRTASSLVSGEGEDPDGAILGRTTSNVAAVLVFVDYPILGVGPGVYTPNYSIEYANRLGLRYFESNRRAHNMYLEWAADLGIVGLTAGVSMIAVTLVQLASLRSFWLPRRREYADLAGAFSLAFIAYASSAIFLHLSYMRYFFALFALASSVIWILERERRAASEAIHVDAVS